MNEILENKMRKKSNEMIHKLLPTYQVFNN